MPEELDAAGQGVLLDAQAVGGQAAFALRGSEVEHLSQRGAVAEQPAREQRIEEPGQVVDGGDQRAGAGGSGE